MFFYGITSFSGQQASPKNGFFTRLARRFPFILRLLKRSHLQTSETQGSSVPERGFTSEVTRNINDVDVITDGSDEYSEYLQPVLNNSNEFPASKY